MSLIVMTYPRVKWEVKGSNPGGILEGHAWCQSHGAKGVPNGMRVHVVMANIRRNLTQEYLIACLIQRSRRRSEHTD